MNFIYKIIFTAILIVNSLSYNIYSQSTVDSHLDSLMTVLSKSREDTNKLYTLSTLARYFLNKGDYANVEKYAADLMTLSQTLNSKKYEGSAYDFKGELSYYTHDHETGLKFFLKSLNAQQLAKNNWGIAYAYRQVGWENEELGYDSLALHNWILSYNGFQDLDDKPNMEIAFEHISNVYSRQINSSEAETFFAEQINSKKADKKQLAQTYFSRGTIFYGFSRYSNALTDFYAALKLYEEIKDNAKIADAWQSIGATQVELLNNYDALKAFQASIVIREKLNLRAEMGQTYNTMGPIFITLGKYDEAMLNYKKALSIFAEPGMPDWGTPMTLTCIAGLYESQGNVFSSFARKDSARVKYELAIRTYKDALDGWAKSSWSGPGIAQNQILMGNIYFKLGNFGLSRMYITNGLKSSGNITDLMNKLPMAYYVLSNLDELNGDYKSAFKHYKLYAFYRDSLASLQNIKASAQTQIKYEFEKKETLTKAEQEKKDLLAGEYSRRQKTIRNSILGGTGLLLISLLVVYRQRNRISREKKVSENLLLNILPAEVAAELKAKGDTEAKQFDEVTVMFTDFKNFTKISEKLSPKELVGEIHTCFKAFDEIITKYNIEKIKTIGDSYMCAGGLPVANKTNATDVVSAALEIQQFMTAHLKERLGSAKDPFEVRIGIHTGPVVAGIVGVKKFAYDIWGDTVNIASRMESSGETGKVNISNSTYELVKDQFNCTYRGKIEAKNKGEIDMYFVELN